MMYGIPMGNKHDIDALTSDFFSAVSFTEGNKPDGPTFDLFPVTVQREEIKSGRAQ